MMSKFWNRAARLGTARGGVLLISGLMAANFGVGKSGLGIGTEARAQALQNPPYLFVSAYDGYNSDSDTHNNENSPVTQTATSGVIDVNYTDPGNMVAPGYFFGSASSAAKAGMGLIGVEASATRNAGGAQAEFVDSFSASSTTPGAVNVEIDLTPALFGMQSGGLGPTETTNLAYTLSYKNAAGYYAGSSSGYYTIYSNGANGKVSMSAQLNGGQTMAVSAIPEISLLVPVGDTVVIYGELDTSVSGTATANASADYIDTAVYALNSPDTNASFIGTSGTNYRTLTDNAGGSAAAPEPGSILLLLPATLWGAGLAARNRRRLPAA